MVERLQNFVIPLDGLALGVALGSIPSRSTRRKLTPALGWPGTATAIRENKQVPSTPELAGLSQLKAWG